MGVDGDSAHGGGVIGHGKSLVLHSSALVQQGAQQGVAVDDVDVHGVLAGGEVHAVAGAGIQEGVAGDVVDGLILDLLAVQLDRLHLAVGLELPGLVGHVKTVLEQGGVFAVLALAGQEGLDILAGHVHGDNVVVKGGHGVQKPQGQLVAGFHHGLTDVADAAEVLEIGHGGLTVDLVDIIEVLAQIPLVIVEAVLALGVAEVGVGGAPGGVHQGGENGVVLVIDGLEGLVLRLILPGGFISAEEGDGLLSVLHGDLGQGMEGGGNGDGVPVDLDIQLVDELAVVLGLDHGGAVDDGLAGGGGLAAHDAVQTLHAGLLTGGIDRLNEGADAAAHGGIQVIGGILDAGNMGQGDDHIALLLAAEQLGHLDAGLGGGAELDALRVQCGDGGHIVLADDAKEAQLDPVHGLGGVGGEDPLAGLLAGGPVHVGVEEGEAALGLPSGEDLVPGVDVGPVKVVVAHAGVLDAHGLEHLVDRLAMVGLGDGRSGVDGAAGDHDGVDGLGGEGLHGTYHTGAAGVPGGFAAVVQGTAKITDAEDIDLLYRLGGKTDRGQRKDHSQCQKGREDLSLHIAFPLSKLRAFWGARL